MRSIEPVIPRQKKGARSDTHYSVRAATEQLARELFQKARLNLLNVNSWHSLAGSGAVFQLVDEKGEEVNELVNKGNYIRIHIPAVPGSKQGRGNEWVKVEKIEEGHLNHHEFTAIRVRPAVPPFADKAEVAHFFSDEATSSFCAVRNSSKVTVSVLGRNETPNTRTHNQLTWIRNLIVSLGAILGFNKPQWKSLARGIIREAGTLIKPVAKH